MICSKKITKTSNINKAIECYEKAVELDNPDAINNLGIIYEDGERDCIEQNISKAIEFYERGYELNHSDSMFNLASIYEMGDGGTEKNILIAIEYYKKSVQLNHPFSINNLARIYHNGEEGIVEKDLSKAIELYEKSIEFNNTDLMYNLALVYKIGDYDKKVKIEIDLDKAAHYLLKSSLLGDMDCMNNLKYLVQMEKLNWRKEYHIYWKSENDLNQQILLILLVSKFRKQSKYQFVSSVLVKGISINIIKLLCHQKQIINL